MNMVKHSPEPFFHILSTKHVAKFVIYTFASIWSSSVTNRFHSIKPCLFAHARLHCVHSAISLRSPHSSGISVRSILEKSYSSLPIQILETSFCYLIFISRNLSNIMRPKGHLTSFSILSPPLQSVYDSPLRPLIRMAIGPSTEHTNGKPISQVIRIPHHARRRGFRWVKPTCPIEFIADMGTNDGVTAVKREWGRSLDRSVLS